MLNLMAHQTAGQNWPGTLPLPLPLPLSCFSTDYPQPLLPNLPIRSLLPHHTHLLLQKQADSAFPDAINRLLLPRLPVLRNGVSSRAPKPLTSFCIRDILGRDITTPSGEEFRSPSRRSDVSSSSSCRSFEVLNSSSKPISRKTSSCSLLSKSRAMSMSPSTPTSISRCSTPNEPSPLTSSLNAEGVRIVRPWIPESGSPHVQVTSDDGIDDSGMEEEDDDDEEDEEINVDDEEPGSRPAGGKGEEGGPGDLSPLDALMILTSKTLTGMHSAHSAESRRQEQEAMFFSRHGRPKKRRKSRTAFSNQQIYQLEKRFLYQKYLTPTDRDDIAHTLGLSNAQVITWFQNRRAKLKRDLEELKNDVTAAKKYSVPRRPSHPDRHPHKRHPHPLHKPAAKEPAEKAHNRCTASTPSQAFPSTTRADLRSSSSSALISDACGRPSSSPGSCHGCNSSNTDVSLGKMHNNENNSLPKDRSIFPGDLDSPSSCDHLIVDDDDNDDDSEAGSLSDQHCCNMNSDGGDSSERSSPGSDSLPPSSLRRPFQSVAARPSSPERQDHSEGIGERMVCCSQEDNDVDILDEPENLSFKPMDS